MHLLFKLLCKKWEIRNIQSHNKQWIHGLSSSCVDRSWMLARPSHRPPGHSKSNDAQAQVQYFASRQNHSEPRLILLYFAHALFARSVALVACVLFFSHLRLGFTVRWNSKQRCAFHVCYLPMELIQPYISNTFFVVVVSDKSLSMCLLADAVRIACSLTSTLACYNNL